MTPKNKGILGLALALGGLSLWMQAHCGLALVVDERTGDKHCVDELAVWLGLEPSGAAIGFAHAFSRVWIVILPMLAAWAAWAGAMRMRAGALEGHAS
ncbi:MAG TPA: hypothetical protein VIP05_13275 [Burkholderiaceae bacterium]